MQALQRVHRSRSIGLPRRPGGLEGAEPAGELRQAAGVHRRRRAVCDSAPPPVTQQAHLRARCRASPPHARRRRPAPITRQRPRAPVGDGGHRLRVGQLRRGDQRSDLGRRLRGVLRPAAGLADVDEADRPLGNAGRADGLLVQLEKEPAFLRAGDQQVVARLGGALERRCFAAAQRLCTASSGGRAVRPAPWPAPGCPAASSGCSRRSASSSGRSAGPALTGGSMPACGLLFELVVEQAERRELPPSGAASTSGIGSNLL